MNRVTKLQITTLIVLTSSLIIQIVTQSIRLYKAEKVTKVCESAKEIEGSGARGFVVGYSCFIYTPTKGVIEVPIN